ncbi:ASCH domain-containing protein [Paraburkholderia tropica]|uniref:ASCH domain-containing protein n=1 Tax=Paraburkholderia tropica TaxID=92647 RepID=UPI001CB580EA|nr:ASCH domain-containing protein [Paraburkholderia tropica]CAG9228326.1 ASCH domain-containing protein [Paraburkholderia tropica]
MDKCVESLITKLAQQGIDLPRQDIRIGAFGDSEALSESLLGLILAGRKDGTCSLRWSWEHDGEAIPKVGDIEIVLDWNDRPALVRRITRVDIVPFDNVSDEFAASEGEGDLSLMYWRTEHWRFFLDECKRIGREPDGAMPLVCERFEVMHVLTR